MDDSSGDYDEADSQYVPGNWAVYVGVILAVVILFYVIEPKVSASCKKSSVPDRMHPVGVLNKMTLGSQPNDEDSATDGLELSLIEEGKMD